MDKEVVLHTYNGIFSIKMNKLQSTEMRWKNLESVIQGEVRKKKTIYILVHIYGT